MILVFQVSSSQISCGFFFTPPTDPPNTRKREWPKPYGFFLGFVTTLLLRISVYLSFAVFCSFFVGEINWNCRKTIYIPFGDSRGRIKKWRTRWFIDRKGNGVGLGLITALRFTRALSNGPEKQKEKWLCTEYSRLDVNTLNQLHEQGEAISPILKDAWCLEVNSLSTDIFILYFGTISQRTSEPERSNEP